MTKSAWFAFLFLSIKTFAEYGYQPIPQGDPVIDSYVSTMKTLGPSSPAFPTYEGLLRDKLHEQGIDHPDMSQFYPTAPSSGSNDSGNSIAMMMFGSDDSSGSPPDFGGGSDPGGDTSGGDYGGGADGASSAY